MDVAWRHFKASVPISWGHIDCPAGGMDVAWGHFKTSVPISWEHRQCPAGGIYVAWGHFKASRSPVDTGSLAGGMDVAWGHFRHLYLSPGDTGTGPAGGFNHLLNSQPSPFVFHQSYMCNHVDGLYLTGQVGAGKAGQNRIRCKKFLLGVKRGPEGEYG